jgi:hypothetical protein
MHNQKSSDFIALQIPNEVPLNVLWKLHTHPKTKLFKFYRQIIGFNYHILNENEKERKQKTTGMKCIPKLVIHPIDKIVLKLQISGHFSPYHIIL